MAPLKLAMKTQLSTRHRLRRRKAAAVVELAVCLPLIVVLAFGALEGANMLFTRQAVVQAAYETAKSTVKSNGSQAQGTLLGTQVLDARNIDQRNIAFSPGNPDSVAPGTPVTVTIRVPSNSRSVTGLNLFQNLTIEASATMLKE